MQSSDLRKEFADILREKMDINPKQFHDLFHSKEKNPYAERVSYPQDVYLSNSPVQIGGIRRLDLRV